MNSRSKKKSLVDPEKIHYRSRKNCMVDPEKKSMADRYIVDPDPAWNYAIPDFAIPSTFPLTSPGQTKWLTGSHPHPSPLLLCPHHLPYVSALLVYEGPAVAVLYRYIIIIIKIPYYHNNNIINTTFS